MKRGQTVKIDTRNGVLAIRRKRHCAECAGSRNPRNGIVEHEPNCPERAARNHATFAAFAAARQ